MTLLVNHPMHDDKPVQCNIDIGLLEGGNIWAMYHEITVTDCIIFKVKVTVV